MLSLSSRARARKTATVFNDGPAVCGEEWWRGRQGWSWRAQAFGMEAEEL